jgi:predicted HTH transcriptional regulator
VNDFAKSSKLVLAALLDGNVTQREILDSTGLAERTLRYAISDLKHRGLIREINSVRDVRRKKYFLVRTDA